MSDTTTELIAQQILNGNVNKRTWGDILYNVKVYGAKGDGVTDDTTAIQSAIDAASTAGGGIVFLPLGTYSVSTSLVLKSYVTLEGAGAKSVIVASSLLPAGSPLLSNSTRTGLIDTYYDTEMAIRNLVLDGNNNASRTVELVSILKAQFLTFDRIIARNTTHMGIALGGCFMVDVVQCEFKNCGRPKPSTISAPAVWVDNHGDGSVNKHVTLENCKFIDNNWSGTFFMPTGGKISKCKFINNGESSIFTSFRGRDIVYDDNYIYGATRSDISASGIETGGFNSIITNNHIYNCQSNGISLTDTQNILIENNIIMNNGQDTSYFAGAAGVGIITTQSSPNQPSHISIKGNRISDNQSTKTQTYGILVGNNGGAVTSSLVADNDLSGNLTSAFKILTATKWGSDSYTTNNIGHASAAPVTGEFQVPATTGAYSVTGLGFRPRVLELHAIEASGTANNQCVSRNTALTSICHYSASSTTASTGSTAGTKAVNLINPAGTATCVGTLTSMDEDGFTLNFSNVTVRPYVMYTAYP